MDFTLHTMSDLQQYVAQQHSTGGASLEQQMVAELEIAQLTYDRADGQIDELEEAFKRAKSYVRSLVEYSELYASYEKTKKEAVMILAEAHIELLRCQKLLDAYRSTHAHQGAKGQPVEEAAPEPEKQSSWLDKLQKGFNSL